jgi:hypothetical protein
MYATVRFDSPHTGFEVVREVENKDDGTADWIKARPEMIIATNVAIQQKVTEILKAHPRLVNASKNESGGDPYLVDVAAVHGLFGCEWRIANRQSEEAAHS